MRRDEDRIFHNIFFKENLLQEEFVARKLPNFHTYLLFLDKSRVIFVFISPDPPLLLAS